MCKSEFLILRGVNMMFLMMFLFLIFSIIIMSNYFIEKMNLKRRLSSLITMGIFLVSLWINASSFAFESSEDLPPELTGYSIINSNADNEFDTNLLQKVYEDAKDLHVYVNKVDKYSDEYYLLITGSDNEETLHKLGTCESIYNKITAIKAKNKNYTPYDSLTLTCESDHLFTLAMTTIKQSFITVVDPHKKGAMIKGNNNNLCIQESCHYAHQFITYITLHFGQTEIVGSSTGVLSDYYYNFKLP